MMTEQIDRITPTQRAAGMGVMRQRWADLLFLHWRVPQEMLRPHLPPGLTLDTFEDQAYIGLVPFTMTGVRPTALPPFSPLSDFHETNVRTYVHREGRDPGVWFFSLDAANAIAVRIARAWYKLPYHFAKMRLDRQNAASGERVIDYASERLWPGPTPAGCAVRYRPTGTVTPAQPGTLEHFLAERYILYAWANDRLFSGRVYHTPYPLQTASVERWDETLIQAAGITRPDGEPLAHYAREVKVDIFSLQRCR